MAVINQHQISCGVGGRDVLTGVDFDLFAGGMFRAEQDFGAFTSDQKLLGGRRFHVAVWPRRLPATA